MAGAGEDGGGALVPAQGQVVAPVQGEPGVGAVEPSGGGVDWGALYSGDWDVPLHPGAYDFSQAAGAASMNAIDRDWVDLFLLEAHAAGFGQQRLREAIGYALTTGQNVNEAGFREFARKRGWPEEHIAVCLKFYRRHKR